MCPECGKAHRVKRSAARCMSEASAQSTLRRIQHYGDNKYIVTEKDKADDLRREKMQKYFDSL